MTGRGHTAPTNHWGENCEFSSGGVAKQGLVGRVEPYRQIAFSRGETEAERAASPGDSSAPQWRSCRPPPPGWTCPPPSSGRCGPSTGCSPPNPRAR
eukprot:6774506-Pyramimonas_sp.AAC.2